MSQPETKVVLGRVFTWNKVLRRWECALGRNTLLVIGEIPSCTTHAASLELFCRHIAGGTGPTEHDAILALQSTLRKMADLEVVG